MKKYKTPMDMIRTLKDPDQIFDLVCAANYFCGNFNQNIPVEESRKAFEVIKKLLATRLVKETGREGIDDV